MLRLGQLALAGAIAACGGGEPTAPPQGTITLTAISTDSLIEGQTVTLTGTGFSATAASNLVTVGTTPAVVTAATTTSLTITVPAACVPLGPADVVVQVGTAASTALSKPFRPTTFFTLAVGQQTIITDPTKFCAQLASSGTDERYLIGLVNTEEDGEAFVTAAVTLATSPAAAAPFVAGPPTVGPMARAALGPVIDPVTTPAMRRLIKHRTWEAGFRRREAASARRLRPAGGFLPGVTNRSASLMIKPSVSMLLPDSTAAHIGDTISVKVVDVGASNLCTTFTTVRAVIRIIGTHGIWMEDVANGFFYPPADLQALSNHLDATIYTTDVTRWGEPTDLDANGRLAVLVSKQVNAEPNVLGFVFSGDLFPPTGAPGQACTASNFGEIYFAKAPTWAGTGSASDTGYTLAEAERDAPLLIAHEFTHVIQNGRRIYGPSTRDMKLWEKEGGATFSEEMNGLAAEARAEGGNYGLAVAWSNFDDALIPWYQDRFIDMALFFGFQSGSTPQLAIAPEQCSFVYDSTAAAADDPCVGGRSVYGNPSLLLRWLRDQVGAGYPGGPDKFLQDMVGSSDSGFTNLANRSGITVPTMLSQYFAMLYVDDQVPGAAARLTLPTWNLFNIYYGSCCGSQLSPRTRLTPDSSAYVNATLNYKVRGGSSTYTRTFGIRSATAIRVRGSDGKAILPANTAMWVVRLQ